MASFEVTVQAVEGVVEADVIAEAKAALAQVENIVITDIVPVIESDVSALIQDVETAVSGIINPPPAS